MNVNKVKLVYFSATGTTRTILESIAKGTGVEDVEHIDMTRSGTTGETIGPFSDELVIIGAPVYGGRLPVDAVDRFKQLKAAETPAVLVVLYGNREFDDALMELKHISVESGFVPVAGGAFIGEHSFATRDIPIANGRPDSQDVQTAAAFGEKIKDKLAALGSLDEQADLEVPGNYPYKAEGAKPMAVSPVTDEDACTLCGTCAEVCPAAVISLDTSVSTLTEQCIRCSVCIKECPEDARSWDDGGMQKLINWLRETCSARKEPEVFGV